MRWRVGLAHAALDLGATAIKAVAMAPDGTVVTCIREAVRGRLQSCLSQIVQQLIEAWPDGRCQLVAVTGARAATVAHQLGVPEVGPLIAVHGGVQYLVPGASAALELGGEHAKFLRFGAPRHGILPLADVVSNAACSAGTGAFLEQEAHRFGLGLDEFARRAAGARQAASIAGRCAVFAKTDLVHKHQNGVPLDELAYGLCLAIAQTIGAELVGSVPFDRPLVLVGGVAGNAGIQRAVREVLGLTPDELVVPDRHAFAAAIGAVVAARARRDTCGTPLREAQRRLHDVPSPTPPPSVLRALAPPSAALVTTQSARRVGGSTAGLVGVDIGSTSTNLAWLGDDGAVRFTRSVPTRAEPLTAVRALWRAFEECHGPVQPRAVGVTGSGRRLVAELLCADLAVNEITAHAEGCGRFFPAARSVCDIGGQDAKFIRLEAGSVVGFEMNKVCSAGTGSFLEEMAALLGLDVVDGFARAAFRSRSPSELGERCTVFMASEIARRLQEGTPSEDLAAGLAYAIVDNYLGRVVGRLTVEPPIVFQGGVAANAAVVAALRQVLGYGVTVHPFNDAAGAIGVALLAGRHAGGASRFRIGGTAAVTRTRSFACPKCLNRCTVHVTRVAERRFFAGGLCDRYEDRRNVATERLDLFAERETAVLREVAEAPPNTPEAVGIPRALLFHDQLPFWAAYLGALGVPYVLSAGTTRRTLEQGGKLARHGTCLPLRAAYGHVADLAAAGVQRILVPSVASLSDGTSPERLSHVCPVVQGWPYTTRALLDGVHLLTPRLRLGLPHLAEADSVAFARTLGATVVAARAALEAGRAAQIRFREAMWRRGDAVWALRETDTLAVLLARPYTVCDPQIQYRLRRVLDDVGIVGVPAEMVRDEPAPSSALHGMYWYTGRRLLQTARAIRRMGGVAAISVSSFGCGPDSFILHMLRREVGDMALLELEVDEHSEFTGIHTRVEAFRWALGATRVARAPSPEPPGSVTATDLRARRLYVPRMSDHAIPFAAAFRASGVDAEVLPPPTEQSVALGRAALDGGECLPCVFVLGDMLHALRRRDSGDPAPAFFMIAGDGPCRLGQYPWLQRAVLDEQGHADVPIFNASQDPEFYEKFGMVPARFQRLAWEATVATDLLIRKWRECRAHSADRTATQQAYHEALDGLARAAEGGTSLSTALRRGFDLLEAVPVHNGPLPVRIGLLGENYVRCNAVANANVAEVLEDLGAEVWCPSLSEWVLYTNWTARLHCRYERQPRRRVMLQIIDALQRFEMARLAWAVRGRLVNATAPSVRRLLQLAARYVPDTFEGETVVGIGRTIDLYARGVSGVIHVAPFGCMVGGMVEGLCHRVSTDLGGFPILHLQYDGRRSEHGHDALEGFLLRAREWQEVHGAIARTR